MRSHLRNSVAPSSVTSIEISVMSSNNDIKESTMQKRMESISEKTSRHLPEDLQQTNKMTQKNKCSYAAIDGNIT